MNEMLKKSDLFTVGVGLVSFKRQIDLVKPSYGGRSSSHCLSLQSTNSTDKKLSCRRETARQLRMFLVWLTDHAIHWIPQLLYNYVD